MTLQIPLHFGILFLVLALSGGQTGRPCDANTLLEQRYNRCYLQILKFSRSIGIALGIDRFILSDRAMSALHTSNEIQPASVS
jgi:hypothetical protein